MASSEKNFPSQLTSKPLVSMINVMRLKYNNCYLHGKFTCLESESKTISKTGIEIYSLHNASKDESECEFIAPHSVETMLGSEEKAVSVLYFAPSKCVCMHCLLSERLSLPSGTSCLS